MRQLYFIISGSLPWCCCCGGVSSVRVRGERGGGEDAGEAAAARLNSPEGPLASNNVTF